MRCLYVASEVAGFAKTGGLADVAAALPRALAERGLDCAVLMPLYRAIRRSTLPLEDLGVRFEVPIDGRPQRGSVWRSWLPDSRVPVFLIDHAEYFDRDDPALGRGLYQYTTLEGQKADYRDNAARFGFFSRAILEVLPFIDFWPDILHVNDWQTGLAPVYLREFYRRHSVRPWRTRYERLRTIFTIHNLAYQGLFWHFDVPMLGLPWHLYHPERLEFHGKLNYLKAGIVFSDLITTVSPTYAREIQTPYLGCGLHGLLMQRGNRLHGIVNGVDDRIWDPAADPHLAARYDVDSLEQGKPRCKEALQRQFHLNLDPHAALLGVVSRLAEQKGIELIVKGVPEVLAKGAQLVVLGDGDKKYREMLQQLRARYPAQVGLHFGVNEAMAHQIEAGADIFLMPSQYEPCGLNQMYSLKYGTVPVVRATGGLADTVVDANAANLDSGKATGFVFTLFSVSAFTEVLQRALAMYRDEPQRWRQLQRTGMRQDWSWNRSAGEYERLYRGLLESS